MCKIVEYIKMKWNRINDCTGLTDKEYTALNNLDNVTETENDEEEEEEYYAWAESKMIRKGKLS